MPLPKRYCTIDGCNREHYAYGLCQTHAVRVKKYGSPFILRGKDISPQEDSQITPYGQVQVCSHGYALTTVDNKRMRVHRAIAIRVIGHPLPKNIAVHHIDGNKLNNNNDNLLICTFAYHNELHKRMRKLMYSSTPKEPKQMGDKGLCDIDKCHNSKEDR